MYLNLANQSMPLQLQVLPSSHWAPSAPIKILEKLEPCLLDKSHESRIDWTYSSTLWKRCENAGCSTGTQAELYLGTFLRSSWKYFRNFLWLFLYTKHTPGPVLRGPRLLSFAFVRLPSYSKFQMEIPKWPTCDQHVIKIDFDSISNYAKLAKQIHYIQWQSMASHWSSGLQGSVKSVAQWCIMSHTKACLCSCRCFHLHTGLLLHLKTCLTNHMKAE